MKVAAIEGRGIAVAERDMPVPGPSEVLIRVRAIGVNRADLLMVAGAGYGPAAGGIPGLEWAGEIEAAGAEVPAHLSPGLRVMATGGAGFAEYALADWGRVIPIPSDDMDFDEACTLPLALMTMHDAIVTNGRLERGQSVLIQGAASGVGIVGLQVARQMGAGLVIGTSTDAGRRERLLGFGADHVLDSRDPDWPQKAKDLTGGRGIDVIIDHVSGPVMNANMAAAAVLGRIVNVGRLGGGKGEFDFDLHALKRLAYIGVTFRTRSVEEVRRIVAEMHRDLWPAVRKGAIRLPIDRRYALSEAAEALDHMRSGGHFGKIVLLP